MFMLCSLNRDPQVVTSAAVSDDTEKHEVTHVPVDNVSHDCGHSEELEVKDVVLDNLPLDHGSTNSGAANHVPVDTFTMGSVNMHVEQHVGQVVYNESVQDGGTEGQEVADDTDDNTLLNCNKEPDTAETVEDVYVM